MTKQEFIDQVSERSGLNKKDAGDAVDAFVETITDTLKRGSEGVKEVLKEAMRAALPRRVRARAGPDDSSPEPKGS